MIFIKICEETFVCVSVTSIGVEVFYKSCSSNSNLTSIINTTGRSFDWEYIITGSSLAASVTGTYDDVNVTTG